MQKRSKNLCSAASTVAQAVDASYGSLKWLTTRRDQRPAVDITSVGLLHALRQEN